MGNSSGKESRPGHPHRTSRPPSRNDNSSTAGPTGPAPHSAADRLNSSNHAPRSRHGSRPDLSFLGLGPRDEREQPAVETRRETKAEREARKLVKERELRAKERERSMKEENVDGGYLVTLGTYTGPEDFSKPTVRQLMIERRIAPFWKGLDDYSESWVEHQLVAAAKGLPIPAPDEVPPESPTRSETSPRGSSTNLTHLTVPIAGRSYSTQSERSMNLSPSHPAFSLPPPTSPIGQSPGSSSPFFRGRAKTLAALSTSTKLNGSQTDLAPQEISLPRDPYVNGLRLEAFLYRDAAECPICFMYYPPYLNKTRCCDQSICSECFVQIKRPDPHAPEHHDDPANPSPPPPPTEDSVNLVCEPAACPYCAQPEFGVTYEAPPFRRGLAYPGGNGLASAASAMSSTSSLNSGLSPVPNRRRATSLSATAPGVITTDRVRPDWAKKLSDARAHAMRRAAAATALHNAAYVLGNQGAEGSRHGFGRRRRNILGGDSPNSSGRGTPRNGEGTNVPIGSFLIPIDRSRDGERGAEGNTGDQSQGRTISRRRVEDIEELMMMEAIRLSLVAEEERKRKEEKEAGKEAKKEEKRKAKEAKKSAKEARKSPYGSSSAMASRASLGNPVGKGKEVDRSDAPSLSTQASSSRDAQQHLHDSRARLEEQVVDVPDSPFGTSVFNALGDSSHRALLREVSNHSSSASSIDESNHGSLGNNESLFAMPPPLSAHNSGLSVPSANQEDSDISSQPTPSGNTSSEPMLNFRSLSAAIVSNEDKSNDTTNSDTSHIERIPEHPETSEQSKHEEDVSNPAMNVGPATNAQSAPSFHSEKDAGPSSSIGTQDQDEITPAVQPVDSEMASYDSKHIGEVSISDTNTPHRSITQ